MIEAKGNVWEITCLGVLALLTLAYGDGVTILSGTKRPNCDLEYKKLVMESTCSPHGGFNQSQALKTLHYASNGGQSNVSLYLTSVIIDLKNIRSLPQRFQPKVNEKFIVTVFVGKTNESSNFTYKRPRVYYAVLNPPIRLNVATNFRFTVHKNYTNWHPRPVPLLSTTYIAVHDFCTGSEKCAKLTKKYRTFGEECSSLDRYDFIAKYGYCENNAAPKVTKSRGIIHWDTVKKTRQTSLLFSNYTWDDTGAALEYEIINVTSLSPFKKPTVHLVTVNHRNCTSSPVNRSYLMAFLCINKQTGNIYSTKALVDNLEPVDVLNVTIRIKDLHPYPPRILTANVTLTSESICTNEYRAFKKLSSSACDHLTFNATIRKVNNHTSVNRSYDVKLHMNVDNPTEMFYVSGLLRVGRATNGSYRVSIGDGSSHATFHATDRYATFHPMVKCNSHTPLSLNVYDSARKRYLSYDEMQTDKWLVILIKNYNYCSAKHKRCIDLYRSYVTEYTKSAQIERKCENKDVFGFRGKFGYCDDIAQYHVTMDIKNQKWGDTFTTSDKQSLKKTIKDKVEDSLGSGAKCEVTPLSGQNGKAVKVTMEIIITGATKDKRLGYCQDVDRIFRRNGKLDSLEIVNVKVISYDCCLREEYGDADFKGVYKFQTTLTSQYARADKRCEHGYKWGNGTIERKCVSNWNIGATWGRPDLSACNTKEKDTGELLDIAKNITQESVGKVAENASKIATDKKISNPKNIELLSEIITSLAKLNITNINVTTNILKCVGAIVAADSSAVRNAKPGSSANILKSLQAIALAQKPKSRGVAKCIKTSNLALGVIRPIRDKQLTIYSQHDHPDDLVDITLNQNVDLKVPDNTKAVIKFPRDVVYMTGSNTIYSYAFSSGNLFLDQSKGAKKSVSLSKVGSFIMSATVDKMNITDLQNPIQLEFALFNPRKEDQIPHCKFWDPNFYVNSSSKGGWSRDGCNISYTDEKKVQCQCNHLTNFAIILDISQDSPDSPALSWITNIGCGISMAGLIMTIITNLMFKNIRKKVPSKILVNLSVSLLMTLFIFLVGAGQVKPQIGCRIIAMLIQYFLLSTFFWMAIEGLNLYRNFVKVFSGGSTGKFLNRCYMLGWGGPFIITVATAGSRWENMGPTKKDDRPFCILHGTPFYFAVLLPVCIILVGNFLVLLLVLRGINGGSKIKSDTPRQRSKKMQKFRIAFACASLLGSTWVFAILAVGDLRSFFQWMFCIFNSLQGAFIFYFYTFRDKKARQEWIKFFNRKLNRDKNSNTSSVLSSKKSESTQVDTLDPRKVISLPRFNMKKLQKKSTDKIEKTFS